MGTINPEGVEVREKRDWPDILRRVVNDKLNADCFIGFGGPKFPEEKLKVADLKKMNPNDLFFDTSIGWWKSIILYDTDGKTFKQAILGDRPEENFADLNSAFVSTREQVQKAEVSSADRSTDLEERRTIQIRNGRISDDDLIYLRANKKFLKFFLYPKNANPTQILGLSLRAIEKDFIQDGQGRYMFSNFDNIEAVSYNPANPAIAKSTIEPVIPERNQRENILMKDGTISQEMVDYLKANYESGKLRIFLYRGKDAFVKIRPNDRFRVGRKSIYADSIPYIFGQYDRIEIEIL